MEDIEFQRAERDDSILIKKDFVLGQWGAVLGDTGLALYFLFKCLADDNRAASLTAIGSQFGLSKKTVMQYARLMEVAKLLEVAAGNNRHSSVYRVYNPAPLSVALLAQIRQAIIDDDLLFGKEWSESISRRFLARLVDPQPLKVSGATAPETSPSSNGNGKTKAADNDLIGRLIAIGFVERTAIEILGRYSQDRVAGWLAYIDRTTGIKRKSGYLLSVLDQQPPTDGGGSQKKRGGVPDGMRVCGGILVSEWSECECGNCVVTE
jgi:hypothetical protein